jgi:hypothetical protein
MLETITPLFDLLLPPLWGSLAAYATWYLTSAKKYVPMTVEEAKTLWEIHAQRENCKSKHWEKIRRGNRIVGFECRCGYKHVQKRHII